MAARGDKCPGPKTSFVEKRMVRTNGMFKRERREERGERREERGERREERGERREERGERREERVVVVVWGNH